MQCGKCSDKFDLEYRLPMNLPCCGQTVCQSCWSQIKQVNRLQTICPFVSCQLPIIYQPQVSKALENLLRKQSCVIFCDKHPKVKAEFKCQDHENPLLMCSYCLLQSHKDHSVIKFEDQMLAGIVDDILEKLKIEDTKIRNQIQIFESLKQSEKICTNSEFLTLIKDMREIKVFEDRSLNDFFERTKQEEEKKIEEAKFESSDTFRFNSKLIDEDGMTFLKESLNVENLKLELIYRGSEHGYSATDFHRYCDNQGPTLTVIKSDCDQIFGGYTSVSWASGKGQEKQDEKAFLFSLTKKTILRLIVFAEEKYNLKSVYHSHKVGPYFGAGTDLAINDLCNEKMNTSNLGFTYSLPYGMKRGSFDSKSYLAGCGEFKVAEIEVFKVIL